ncbi:aldo/keto reductase [Marinilabiliaceae bacterium JC017]|nr:aldo/keto reductase [Marinilabiliaceae bacterium JC017]
MTTTKPGIGFYKVPDGETTINTVKWAIEAGYRHFDCASFYKNEYSVGNALKESGIPRNSITITSKIWNDEQGYDNTLKAFERSLQRLQTDYLDYYLIHWPIKRHMQETWQALEELHQSGKVKAIGVSNFYVQHLEYLLSFAHIMPAIDQVELHPYLQQKELIAFCRQHNISVEAWSPLMRGHIKEEEVIREIARNHGKSPAQITIRWHLQKGLRVIPKSIHQERIHENMDVLNFELTQQELAKIDQLDCNRHFGTAPDKFYNL